MSPVEGGAAGLTLASVALAAVRNAWCWPVGAVAVVGYFFVFLEAHLYADMALQVAYFGMQCYGGYRWARPGDGPSERPPGQVTGRQALILAVVGLSGTAALGAGLQAWTDAALPFADSAAACFSLVAVWLMARRLVETWPLWIGLNLAYILIFLVQRLYVSLGLYVVLVGVNVFGYLNWARAMGRRGAEG